MKDRYLPVLENLVRITEGKVFLMYGTLLGCIRDKEFIPWDDDMDIGILEEDWKDEYLEEFNKLYQTTHHKRNDRFSKIRVLHGKDHTCFNIMRKDGERYFTEGDITMMIPDKFLQEFKEVDFYNLKVKIPARAEELLTWDYGDWKKPQKVYSWADKPGVLRKDVSLIIPTYNRAGLTDRCVAQALHDTKDLEVIWVDDASTDNVREVMGKYPIDISIIRKENKGIAVSYNNGIKVSNNSWIAVMDADFELPENWLAKCREYIDKIPTTDIVGIHIDGFKNWIGDVKEINNTEVREMKHAMGFYVVKREFFDRVGLYREDWGWYGPIDADWTIRAKELNPVMYFIPGLSVKHLGVGEWDEGEYRERKDKELKRCEDYINNMKII